ncbi:hypothetical protein LXJ59_28245, partial [Escherichia coli]|nr:hypothetical protein [Escherichia coli]
KSFRFVDGHAFATTQVAEIQSVHGWYPIEGCDRRHWRPCRGIIPATAFPRPLRSRTSGHLRDTHVFP